MKYFTIAELCASATAERYHIDNTPGLVEEENLRALVANVLDPLREMYGRPIYVSSGFRSQLLNMKIRGADNSQHLYGQAADIYCKNSLDNARLFELIAKYLPFDQLIWEKGNLAYPDWVHVSWKPACRFKKLRYDGRRYISIR